MFAREVTVANPGGNVAGKFTAAWLAFWSQQGQNIFDEMVAPELERGIEKISTPKTSAYTRGGTVSTRLGKSKLRSFNLMVDASAAKAQAEMQTLRKTALDKRWGREYDE